MSGGGAPGSTVSTWATSGWVVRTLLALCLVFVVATEVAPVARNLRWWLGAAARTQPYELRLQLNGRLRDAVLAAHALTAALPGDAPVLIDNRGGPDWFLALKLQPRRVYFDRPRVRRRLTADGEPFVVAYLDREDGTTRWWFESHDGAGLLLVKLHEPPTIHADSFEDGLDGWDAVVSRKGP
jgi:hypothetical protein